MTVEMILERAPLPWFRIKIEMPECLKEPQGMSAPCLLPFLRRLALLSPVDILDTVEVYFGGNNGTRRVTAVETPTPLASDRYYLETFSNQPSRVSQRLLATPCSLFAFQPIPATVDGSTPRARSSWSPLRWRAEQHGRTARTTGRSLTETAVDCASCTKRAAELSVWLPAP